MDVIPFIQFSLNSRYVSRWIYGGLLLYIPVLNFFSLGYLSKVSRVVMIGSVGLPTWDRRYEIWMEGAKMLLLFILYGAIPFFMFSCGFFLQSLSSLTGFFGGIMIQLSYVALFISSFFLPFAFITFSEKSDFRQALEFEKILRAIKEVTLPYLAGYVGTVLALFICWRIIPIPKAMFFQLFMVALLSVVTYYILLVSTYYFTQIFRRTSLSTEIVEREVPLPLQGLASPPQSAKPAEPPPLARGAGYITRERLGNIRLVVLTRPVSSGIVYRLQLYGEFTAIRGPRSRQSEWSSAAVKLEYRMTPHSRGE